LVDAWSRDDDAGRGAVPGSAIHLTADLAAGDGKYRN
jgi:hypothetical protein